MSSSMNTWFMIGAAFIGVVSAAGVMIAEHYKQKRRKHSMASDLARLDRQVNSLRDQLEMLKKRQQSSGETKTRSRRHKMSSAMSALSDEYNSARELDSSDMEFYDLSDDELTSSGRRSPLTVFNRVLREVDDNLDGDRPEVALGMLEGLLLEHPESPDVLWRIGKAYYKMTSDPEMVDRRTELIQKGMQAVERALFMKGDCFESHKWCAMLLGQRMLLAPLRDRINDSIAFKKHLDAAIAVRTNDIALLHSLGRYHYEIASMKWYERKVFNALCGEVPDCSIEEAERLFQQVEQLSVNSWKDNKLALAKCFITQGNYAKALELLDDAKKISPTATEEGLDVEINGLLSKYNGYR